VSLDSASSSQYSLCSFTEVLLMLSFPAVLCWAEGAFFGLPQKDAPGAAWAMLFRCHCTPTTLLCGARDTLYPSKPCPAWIAIATSACGTDLATLLLLLLLLLLLRVVWRFRYLQQRGSDVTRTCQCSLTGGVDPAAAGGCAAAGHTALVSIMAVNNEIGGRQPLAEIGALVPGAPGVLPHQCAGGRCRGRRAQRAQAAAGR